LSRESRAFGPCGVPTSLAHNSGRGQPLFWGGSETGQHARRALREPPQRGIVLTEGDSHARGKDMGAVPMGAHRNPPSGPPLCYERPHPPFRVPLGLWGPGAARCVLAGAWARGPLSAPVQGVRAVWAHPGPSPHKTHDFARNFPVPHYKINVRHNHTARRAGPACVHPPHGAAGGAEWYLCGI
jgi:hypothetical protein